MSQKLRELVRPHLGTTEGSRFLEKAISPSAPIGPQRVPDSCADPTAVIESTRTVVFTPALFGLTVGTLASNIRSGTTVRYGMVTCPAAGIVCWAFCYYQKGDASGIALSAIGLVDTSPLLVNSLADANSASMYRMTASSFTAQLDANATNNQGYVYAVEVGNSYTRITGPLTGGDAMRAQYAWKGAVGATTNNASTALTQVDNIVAKAGNVNWRAVDGMYGIQRNEGNFLWHRADDCDIQSPQGAGTAGQRFAVNNWEPCTDWTIGTFVADNIALEANVPIKFIRCFEIKPELGSILSNIAEVSATDLPALNVYKTLTAQFGAFYPADFNDWGTLWQGVKNFFSSAKPLISKAAQFIPTVGPVISGMIDAIPVQTKAARESAMATNKARAEARATIEAANLKNAQKVLSEGKLATRPKPFKATTAVVDGNVKFSNGGKGVKCPFCKRGFANMDQVKKHIATSSKCVA